MNNQDLRSLIKDCLDAAKTQPDGEKALRLISMAAECQRLLTIRERGISFAWLEVAKQGPFA